MKYITLITLLLSFSAQAEFTVGETVGYTSPPFIAVVTEYSPEQGVCLDNRCWYSEE